MVGSRRLLRLELDLPRTGREGSDHLGSPILLWPRSSVEPPEVPDAIVASIDGEMVRMRAPGARLSESFAIGEWRVFRGTRVRVSWGTSIQDSQVFEVGDSARAAAGVAHVELDVDGVGTRRIALPTVPGTRMTFGPASRGADVSIEDSAARDVVGRITFDGKEYRADSPDSGAMALVNGVEVFWPVALGHGDLMTIGSASLRFLTTPPAGALESPEREEASPVSARGPARVAVSSARSWIGPALVVGSVAAAIGLFLVYVGVQVWGGSGR